MIKVGVIGLGMMGTTHLDVYAKRNDVCIFAVADTDPNKLAGLGSVEGNLDGLAKGGVDLSGAKKYDEGMDLIKDAEVELVDICLPTDLHAEYAVAALKEGKHVLVEKPLALNVKEAQQIVDAASSASGFIMPAMCMRFWPGWDWLKQAISSGKYGKVLSATFRRVSPHPGGPFYSDGEASGGGVLDLHIHDADFIMDCFGMPLAVKSSGYRKCTNHFDHVITQYIYEEVPIVVAEGGWAMTDGFVFSMSYTVNFEEATADFDFSRESPLMLAQPESKYRPVTLVEGLGYEYEIEYFLKCIVNKEPPRRVKLQDAVDALQIVEAEIQSIVTHQLRNLS